MQMSLASLFQGECFLPGLRGKNKEAVFHEMVSHLVATKRIPADLSQIIVESLMDRESKLTTAVGEGIALPHASIQGLPQVVVIAGRHSEGLECSATDGKPIIFFLMVLVPSNDYAAHLRTLAEIGKFFSKPGMKQNLAGVENREQLLRLIRAS